MAEFPWMYEFEYDDGGRSSSKRPKQKNDCVVRAIAIARGIPYDEAYDMLKAAGRRCSRGVKNGDLLNVLGQGFTMPAVKGQPRMHLATFCARYYEGVYILRVAKHVLAVVDGVVHDTARSRNDRCVYRAWQIK